MFLLDVLIAMSTFVLDLMLIWARFIGRSFIIPETPGKIGKIYKDVFIATTNFYNLL